MEAEGGRVAFLLWVWGFSLLGCHALVDDPKHNIWEALIELCGLQNKKIGC